MAVIIGPTVAATEMAVAAYLNKVGIPQILTNPSPTGVNKQNLKWTIQAGGIDPQMPSAMAKYAYETLKYKTITVISQDSASGHGFSDPFMATFKKLGGQVIQEQYAPVGTSDFASYIATLKDADICVAWFNGADAVNFLTQYEQLGLWKRMSIVAPFHGGFFGPFIVSQLPPAAREAVLGKLCPSPYSPLIDNAANKLFVAAHREKFEGKTPEDTQSGPYQGGLITLAALKATGGDTTPEKLRQAILDLKIEIPEGPLSFNKELMVAIKDVYISKIDKPEKEFMLVPVYTYKEVPPLGY